MKVDVPAPVRSEDARAHLKALNRIESDDTRAAYLHLLVLCERFGLKSSAKTGRVAAVRLHDRDERICSHTSRTRVICCST